MELRRLAVCLVFLVLALSQCSEAHSVRRRQVNSDVNYDDNLLNDEAGDEEVLNDTENIAVINQAEPQKVQAIIETLPTHYEVKSGDDIRLECRVSPENGSVVQWLKNNEQYFLGNFNLKIEEVRYSIAPNSKDLIIKNAQATDSGVFKCEIMQKPPVSITHTVLVTAKPKVLSMTATDNGIVVEGSELVMTCHVTGSPMPTVMWSRTRNNQDNERLTEKVAEFAVNGNDYYMKISNIKFDEAGQYYCYAINDAGSDQAETNVIVKSKPRVHVTKTIVNSDIMIEAVLQCSAHEDSSPLFRWYKDSALIENRHINYKISTYGTHSNLTVSPTTDADFGTFTCEAENDYGKHNRSIELVQSPVVEDLEVDGPKMSWRVHSHQPIEEMEVQLKSFSENGEGEWRTLTVPLPKERHHEYEVAYLLEDKQLEPGEYQAIVKVKNSKSWGGSNEPVVVKIENEEPQFIQHASVYRGNSAHSIRPAYAMLSTILMYLLVRMF